MTVSYNPYTNDITFEGAFDSLEELENKLLLSKTAQQHWKATTLTDRIKLFLQLADNMNYQKKLLAETISIEMGKPIKESIAEIEKCIHLTQWYAEHVETFLKQSTSIEISTSTTSHIQYEPIGTILGIMPWNFPFWQVFRFAIPTLLAGNTVILKHAPNVQGCSSAMQALFEQSGFTSGIFLSAFASVEHIETLIASPVIQGVSFTGSEKAGREVAKLAGAHIKKCVLELGGSDPFIVLSDANLFNCVEQAIKSRLVNNGQSCIAAKRFIIHTDCYDAFMTMLKTSLSKLKVGNPLTDDTDLGPMARTDLKEQLSEQVNKTIQSGAAIYYKHPFNDVNNNFFSPIILENIPTESPARQQELFGPVFTCIKVFSEEEAITIANETSFGLAASIWTRNIEHAKKISDQIESGSVFINDMVRSDVRIPFGGIKNSGFGRELSIYGMHEFVNIKTHWVAR